MNVVKKASGKRSGKIRKSSTKGKMAVVEKDTPMDVILGIIAIPLLIIGYTIKFLYIILFKVPSETNRFIGAFRTVACIMLLYWFYSDGVVNDKDVVYHSLKSIGLNETIAGLVDIGLAGILALNVFFQFVFIFAIGIKYNMSNEFAAYDRYVSENPKNPGITSMIDALDARLSGRSYSGMKDVMRDFFGGK